LIAKVTIKSEHDHYGEHVETIKEKIQKLTLEEVRDNSVWKVDPKKPNTFEFANEYVFKPSLIRSYQKRSKTLNILRYAFEKSTALYDAHSPHADHGHGDHGHDDHGHGEHHHDGHGKNHGNDHNGHSEHEGHSK
jgi:hypothetical protein